MEFILCEVASSADGEDGKHGVVGVGVEEIGLMIVVVLEVNHALERDSSVRLGKNKNT